MEKDEVKVSFILTGFDLTQEASETIALNLQKALVNHIQDLTKCDILISKSETSSETTSTEKSVSISIAAICGPSHGM